MDLSNISEPIPAPKIRQWRKFFSKRGTRSVLQRETSVSRNTLRKVLLNKRATKATVDKIQSFITDYEKNQI